ncbi:hypothetical protein [Francisella sp. SYW-9]|uniref:hypothetical protein n=1 Tax=Francisella sp. SYW-9 TaxID=2610888 RepID=UPI00123D4BC9|nr:hypothetical protein [Francisella sp. SYW-9]
MYTVTYRRMINAIGKEWTDKVFAKCERYNIEDMRIGSIGSHYEEKFINFIGDKGIAYKIADEFQGEQILMHKYLKKELEKLAKTAVEILFSNGLTVENIDCVLNSYIDRKIIRQTTKQYGLII